jgi:hypothetical protein
MKGWSRNAVTFGVASAVVTLLLNWIGNATGSGDACHRSSPLGLLAFLIFLGLMGGAGFMTARAGGTIGMATMAGLVAALISAVGTVIAFAIIVSSINASQCVVNNNTGVSSQTLLTTGGIVAGVILSVIGLGVGAGAGAIGGLMGRRPAATTTV